jgi:hypothetical protein
MIEHLVFFRCRATVTSEIRGRIIRSFQALQGVIPGLLEVAIAENTSDETQFRHGYDLGLRMRFVDRAHLRAYLDHRSHRAVAELVLPSVDDIAVCDLELP